MSLRIRLPLQLELLEDRVTPIGSATGGAGAGLTLSTGILQVTPSAGPASPPPINIAHQVSAVVLPNAGVITGHGLKTAEAHSPVVDWTPT